MWVGGHNHPPRRGLSSRWAGVGLAVGKAACWVKKESHIILHASSLVPAVARLACKAEF